jgi:hypothetical protein
MLDGAVTEEVATDRGRAVKTLMIDVYIHAYDYLLPHQLLRASGKLNKLNKILTMIDWETKTDCFSRIVL